MFPVRQVGCSILTIGSGPSPTVNYLTVQCAFKLRWFVEIPSYSLSWIVSFTWIIACYCKNRRSSIYKNKELSKTNVLGIIYKLYTKPSVIYFEIEVGDSCEKFIVYGRNPIDLWLMNLSQ